MSRRVAHRWLTWLLPLLVLRAFVPAGFMLGASSGELQLMLCSGAGPVATQAQASVDDPSHTHHHVDPNTASHEHGGSKVHENSICPFAAAGTTGVPIPAYAPAVFTFEPLEHFAFLADPELRSAPVLIDRIRGPPAV
jgi:hypothetical protein